jgi:hypothetical protein
MVDRYARDALACYGRLRQHDEAEARAELELFDDLMVLEGLHPGEAGRSIMTRSAAPRHRAVGSA